MESAGCEVCVREEQARTSANRRHADRSRTEESLTQLNSLIA